MICSKTAQKVAHDTALVVNAFAHGCVRLYVSAHTQTSQGRITCVCVRAHVFYVLPDLRLQVIMVYVMSVHVCVPTEHRACMCISVFTCHVCVLFGCSCRAVMFVAHQPDMKHVYVSHARMRRHAHAYQCHGKSVRRLPFHRHMRIDTYTCISVSRPICASLRAPTTMCGFAKTTRRLDPVFG